MFKLDPFQRKAIDVINDSSSLLVAAPTGAGKTVIAEHVIESCLQKKEKVIYTSPIKALSNQKFRDFNQQYPNSVGLLTGDVTINPHAPALIMTTEIFRNRIIEKESDLCDYSWIIFDELHYLDDLERGSVWEESLMFLPDHMNVLGLSATVPNIKQIAQWLRNIHNRPVKVIIENHRPVPLTFFIRHHNKIYSNLVDVTQHVYQNILPYPAPLSIKKGYNSGSFRELQDFVKHLVKHENLPCIYFCFSRKKTKLLAEELMGFNFLTPDEHKKILAKFNSLCKKYGITHEPSMYDIKPLVERGIAYHHAGMLPTLKEIIEQLFTTKLIKMIFTTETFALGINMPARSVSFDELGKIYANRYHPLKTRDFFQMAGRAGRRGIDEKGYVFCRLNPYDLTSENLEQMLYGEPEKVRSHFNASYATLLNLYQTHSEKLYELYPLSLHYFQRKKNSRRQAVELMHSKIKLLKQLGHIKDHQITIKGNFASKVYGYELLLAELFDNNILEQFNINELVLLTMAVVYEPRRGVHKPRLSRTSRQLQRMVNDFSYPLLKMEHSFQIRNHSKLCAFHLNTAMEAWLDGASFQDICHYTDAEEGEIIRYFRMTLQVLRDIYETPISKQFKTKVFKAMELIKRDEVDAEKQLRV
jgi:superfamily II RNA helicase